MNRRRLLAGLALLAGAALVAGCGKKGKLEPPPADDEKKKG